MKKAFTMIELVFVIVILGVLASIAVSKMAVTRDDAMIVKGKAQVSAIRSAIVLQKSKNMMRGLANGGNPTTLDALGSTTSSDGDKLFDYDTNASDSAKKLLDYPVYSKDANGHWRKTAANEYTLKVVNTDIVFTYNSGSFDCNRSAADPVGKYCKALSE